MLIPMNNTLSQSEDGSLLENDDQMRHITYTTRQVHIITVLFSHQVTLEKRQEMVFLSYSLLSKL